MRHIPLLIFSLNYCGSLGAQHAATYDYRVLATSRTSTMEKEMNEAADAGYMFGDLIGGEEVLIIMIKTTGAEQAARRRYKFLATSRTGTMERELQQAGDEGFEYRSITVYKKEVAVVRVLSASLRSSPSVQKQ